MCFEDGFDLAVRLAQMGALEKYAGRNLTVLRTSVFDASVEIRTCYFFIAADEDEVLERLANVADTTA